jgi:hypothetical protein
MSNALLDSVFAALTVEEMEVLADAIARMQSGLTSMP